MVRKQENEQRVGGGWESDGGATKILPVLLFLHVIGAQEGHALY